MRHGAQWLMNAHDRIFRQCEQSRYDLFLLVDVLVLWISVSFVEEEDQSKDAD